jgi:LAS superfamily LD-carboxypeptidase LdcB
MSISQTTVPGCQALTTYPGQNGRLPASELCDLWPSPYQDRSDAVLALTALDVAYKAAFGTDMRLTSAYRTVEQQADLKRARGAFAAPPGQSNHGWGLAVDLCASVYEGQSGAWLRDVGPVYGWDNPAWALRGGGGPYEPWHWEYVPGVQALAAGGVGE